MAPVTAQVMMTLSSMLTSSTCSTRNIFRDLLLVGGQRHQPAIAPGLSFLQFVSRQLFASFGFHSIQEGALPIGPGKRRRRNSLINLFIPLHIIPHAARGVEIDRLKRPHERPAQR